MSHELPKEGPELDALVAERVMGEPRPAAFPEDALEIELVGSPVTSELGCWFLSCEYEVGDDPV